MKSMMIPNMSPSITSLSITNYLGSISLMELNREVKAVLTFSDCFVRNIIIKRAAITKISITASVLSENSMLSFLY
ncbi:MAG TPA: hypothetical protein ENG42_01755 [Candidatus Aenigmarchaeota archaeon]|nr:MAG: hypothetical protein DRP03_00180 [Candidatus Aenigmarchaeota archaeon]HDD46174.1 hypothetical protein [Candidatus Aenigmarchaeota archaeon]